MESSYSILINTCDNFEDCWDPFFKLWSVYWPDCNGQVLLNTEYKEYYHQGLNINSLKVCEKNKLSQKKRATWSQCLKWALNEIDTDIVLYLQEDYFLKDHVRNDILQKYINLMGSNPSIQCIHLTDQAVSAEEKSEFPNLNKVLLNQRYRVSCQAALWRKAELLDLIREYEDAWEFEEFGSMRSAQLKKNYYVVDKAYVQLNRFEIIPYIFTGIIQGRWNEECVPLFKKNNITVDFSKRGFIKDVPPKSQIKRIKYRGRKILRIILNRLDLIKLKHSFISK